MPLSETMKGWLLVITTIMSVSLQAILAFADLSTLDQSMRVFYLALCALLIGVALLYWSATSVRTPLETTALLALLTIASTAAICISATYHNLTDATRLVNGRLVYVLRAANTAVDIDVSATTTGGSGSVEPSFYDLDTQSALVVRPDKYYELDNHVIVKGFKRPYVLTVAYPVPASGAPRPTLAAQGVKLLSMADVRADWRRTIILGVLAWILFSSVAFWCSSRWSPLKRSEPLGFQPPPTPTKDGSSTL